MSIQTLEQTPTQEPGMTSGEGFGMPRQNESFSADEARHAASQAIDQVKEKAGQAADSAREVVRGQVENRASQASGQASNLAADLRKAAQSLRQEGSQTFVADFAERAAGTVEQAAGYLENADLETLVEDFKRFGREKPWAVAGGLFALGFAASRLIKVTAQGGQE